MYEAHKEFALPSSASSWSNNLSVMFVETKMLTYACICSKYQVLIFFKN